MKYLTCSVRGLPLNTTKSAVEDHFNAQMHPDTPCAVSKIVEDVRGHSSAATVTFRKEKRGRARSCGSLREAFNRSGFRGGSKLLSVTDDFLGLTPLSGPVDAPIHIYFVHGIGGHAFKTWCSDVDDDIKNLKSWPRDFLPKGLLRKEIDARVFTLGYNANIFRGAAPNADITSTAENLLASLIARSSRPNPKQIYFVCHSLGGLIVCQALIMALFEDEEYVNKDVYRNLFQNGKECLVKGICFLGTPFYGSGQANVLVPLVRAVKGLNRFSATNDAFLASLRENSQSIEVPQIVQRFKSIVEGTGMTILIGCEDNPVVSSNLTVSKESAKAIFNDTATPFHLPGDHRTMAKFDNEERTEYKFLEGLILQMIANHSQSQPNSSKSMNASIASTSSRPTDETTRYHQAPWPGHHTHVTVNFPQDPRNSTYDDQQEHYDLDKPNPIPRQQTFPLRLNRPSVTPSNNSVSAPEVELANAQKQSGGFSSTRRSQTDRQSTSANTDDDYLNRLKMFDTVFIVDDTGSMTQSITKDGSGPERWDVTVQALGHIAELAARYDEDGIDIRFLKDQARNADNVTSGIQIRAILDKVNLSDPIHGGGTEFWDHLTAAMGPHLMRYEQYLEESTAYKRKQVRGVKTAIAPKKPKFLNLIVLTDGQANDEQEVEEYIVDVAEQLDNLKAPKGYIGVQFVQIGDDDRAKKYLKRLDDDLKKRDPPIRDIVDTTPFNPAVSSSGINFGHILEKKVLLGAVTRLIDDLENDSLLDT